MEIKLKEWKIKVKDESLEIAGNVPGDITNDLHKAGVIADPFFGLNHLDLREWLDKDYIYSTTFEVEKMPSAKEDAFICFEGVTPIEPMNASLPLKNPIYVDTAYIFRENNKHIPSETRYHNFLINSKGEILLVGNPLENKKIRNILNKLTK